MYVAFLLPDLKGGGAQKMLINLANWFARRGHQCDLILFNGEGIYGDLIADEVRVCQFNKRRAFQAVPELVKYLKQQQPDVLLSALYYVNVLALISKVLCRQCPTKLVLSERNHLSQSLKRLPLLKRMFWKGVIGRLYPLSDSIVGISDGVCDDLKTYLPRSVHKKIKTIYNPVITDESHKALQEDIDLVFPKDCSLKLITSGRLVPQKDYPTLLRAFSLYRQKDKKAHLVILGVGYLEDTLKELCRTLNIENNVSFVGFVNNPLAYLKQADVFLITSVWEGFCNVIVEALFCGLSVVATDCPSGPAEILKNGEYGSLCAVGDIKGLSLTISKVALGERPGLDGGQRALNFHVDKIAEEFHLTFLSLVQTDCLDDDG